MTHDRAAKPTIREIVYNWWSPTQPGTTSIHDLDALVSSLEYREMQWPERAPELRKRVVELKGWAEDRNDAIGEGRVQAYNSVLALLDERLAAAEPREGE